MPAGERENAHVLNEDLANLLLARIRAEFTVMPRFGFHQPLDYNELTLPPDYEEPALDPGSGLPIPPPKYRFGYSPNDTAHYLAWGKYDHDELVKIVRTHHRIAPGMSVLDLGCSSGRVLRHFQAEWQSAGWRLYGCDVQALPIQWMRSFFPQQFVVTTTSAMPHLPFEDNKFDFIYGISVFTHIKFLWDAWLLELKRVLKPGGLMVQTIHAESAWEFYSSHRDEQLVRDGLPARVRDTEHMDVDFLYFGDVAVSQVFWRGEVAAKYWGRYLEVLEMRDPPGNSFQDWIVCRKA